MPEPLRVAVVTREYPPEIYGGAGVHVEYLVRALKQHVDVRVHAFGKARSAPEVAGSYEAWNALAGPEPELAALRTLSVDLLAAQGVRGSNLVHTHTWYANFAGHLAKLAYGVPHVMTSHSLEPLRPWKVEQLGGGYAISSFCERTAIVAADAVIAVSNAMKADILGAYPTVDPQRIHVIHNGIEPGEYRPGGGTDALARHGIDPASPYVVFVGRVTRQKGIVHLLRAARHVERDVRFVLCAGEPDTPEIGAEFRALCAEIQAERGGIVVIEGMLKRPEVSELLSHARVFVCPSVYEPFGIVNLEAMACGVPVVASAVGGIPEIVVEGETGLLVRFEGDGSAKNEPREPEAFARSLAQAITSLTRDPERARRFGAAGRKRVIEHFSWNAIAVRTAELYRSLVHG